MKKKSFWKDRYIRLFTIMMPLIVLCMLGCKDDESEDVAFDPNKPIVITDFTPKEGGVGNNLILYGDNFGNDPSKLKLIIGGKEANIVNVKNQILYCVVPRMAVDGNVEISVCDDEGEEIAYAEAEEKFTYVKQWLVSTLAGQRFEKESDVFEDNGSFDNCGAIKGATWFSFDPKSNFDHLYMTAYDIGSCRLIDLEQKTVTMLPELGTKTERPTIINWTADENQDMIVSRDLKNNGAINIVLSRASKFKTKTLLEDSQHKQKGVCGAFVHPKTGILYYSLYETQPMWQYNFEKKEFATFASHMRTKETLRMVVHPTGKYAYLMRLYSGNGNSYIAKMDYDEISGFSEPYIIAGHASKAAYKDGVGGTARLNGPGQGVFVENPEYAGAEDKYDFYFTDEYNHCVRILTPTGRVTTFAGRGNGSTTGGYANGAARTEARFFHPWAIAYDEKRRCFYVGERGETHDGKHQAVIRKIYQEE